MHFFDSEAVQGLMSHDGGTRDGLMHPALAELSALASRSIKPSGHSAGYCQVDRPGLTLPG
jgi:hypothetical protein